MKSRKFRLSFNTILITVLFVSLVLFIVFCLSAAQNTEAKNSDIRYLTFSGTYTLSSDKMAEDIPPDRKIKIDYGFSETIKFRLHLHSPVHEGEKIHLFSDSAKITVSKNDEEIYSGGFDEDCPDIVSSAGKDWVEFISPSIEKSDTLTITVTPRIKYLHQSYIQKFLNNIAVGSTYDLLADKLVRNLPHIVISMLIFTAGIILVIIMFSLRIMHSPAQLRDLSSGFVMICGGLSVFINYDYITLLIRNAFLVNIAEFTVHLFVLYFILLYLRIYTHGKTVKRASSYFLPVWSIIILIFFLSQVSGESDYINFSFNAISSAIILILFTLLFLIIDYRNTVSAQAKITIVSAVIILTASLAEIVIKIFTGDFIYSNFEAAVIIFSAIQLTEIMLIARKSIIQASRADKIERELLQSKVSIMLSQIQPHFLYNTLVVIRQLCDIDPKTAKEAITEFAGYLRGNLDSLTLNTTISFEKEMEHVENYISLEKKRFGDKIDIDYDIEAFDFNVPSLTIQTIVENAVRHGITKRKEGGTVKITTRENAYNYTVEIMDNGIGTELSKQSRTTEKDRSHVGIDNARKRIEIMCDGTLEISSTPNVGTTVLITIPKPFKY